LRLPEHRAETPSSLRTLESFLWHDFDLGQSDWAAWGQRKMPETAKSVLEAAFDRAMQLHSALRILQAANSHLSIEIEIENSREQLNQLITHYQIYPCFGKEGDFLITSEYSNDPVAHLLLVALEALRAGTWRRFKLCHEPTCRASYYDASKQMSKIWCSMETCGSRNKMRRYRAKS
jgi:hypothetical protein